jgi:hypothetical protein
MNTITFNGAGMPNPIAIPYNAFLETRTMTVEDFLACQYRYQQLVSSLKDSNNVAVTSNQLANGFTFQTIDLLNALGITYDPDINEFHVRGYFGLDETGNMKILFVAAVGADLNAPHKKAGQDAYFIWANNSSDLPFVLDLNYPCPPLCPGNEA